MPPVQAGASVPYHTGMPRRFVSDSFSNANVFTKSVANNGQGELWVITNIDSVAKGSSGQQQFCDYLLSPGGDFYHDSQSIGEGGGVWFSWRGALPMYNGDELVLSLQSSDTAVTLSHIASGFVIPWYIGAPARLP